MAKKQQPKLSYGPNMGLIAGEAQLAASETALANVNQSFVTGAAAMFGAIQQANKERDAKMEAYETQVGGLPDINQFEDPKNKQIIKNFLNTQRDEYVRLADLYENTKDRDVKDKMEQIKFSLVNLNDQIKTFNQDKLDYRTANEENQLASLRTYQEKDGTDFFTNAFTNNAAFSIDEAGDMVFGINKNSYKYRDKAGKWNSKNNIDESNVLKMYGDVYKSGGKGDKFNADNVRRGLYNSFKNTGNSALQVFVTTDLTSDTSGLSFEEQFASGSLKEKHPEMYKGFTPDKDGNYNTDWMFENKNGDILRNKVSDYFTKVMEDGHGQGRTDNYKAPPTDTDEITAENPYGFTTKTNEIEIGSLKGYGQNKYRGTFTVEQATLLLDKVKAGKGFKFANEEGVELNYNYLFDNDNNGAWHVFAPGQDPNKITESSFFGNANDLETDIFKTMLPQFQNLETKKERQKVKLDSSGNPTTQNQSDLNPFDITSMPEEFVTAVGKDDNDVISYLNNLKTIDGLSAKKGYNLDSVIVTLGEGRGNSKQFTVDPNISSDEQRAKEIWSWLSGKYGSKKKFD